MQKNPHVQMTQGFCKGEIMLVIGMYSVSDVQLSQMHI